MEEQIVDLEASYIIAEGRFVAQVANAAPERRAGIIADNLEDLVNLRVAIFPNLNAGDKAPCSISDSSTEVASPQAEEYPSFSVSSLVRAAKTAKGK